MTGPQVKSSKPPKLPTQVTNEGEKTFEKEEHQLIYRAFLDILENPENLEKQTKQEIEKKKQKLKEELSDQEKQKLQSNLKSLYERLERLQNGNEKKIFTFISKNHEGIFKNINQEDIKLLSEENFSQLLLSVFKKIRKENLANEENLKNDKIKQVVNDCITDIRGTEAWDWVVDSAKRKIPLRELLEKIPGLGKVLGIEKEEDEPPLSDEEMVTTFLRKVFLPVLFSIASISIFGPTTLAVVAAAIGAIFAIKGGVGVLFSNDKKGTLYNPDSQDEKQRKEWDKEISDGISKILETSGKGAGKGEQPTEEQLTQKSEQSTMLEQVTLEQLAQNTGQQPSKTT